MFLPIDELKSVVYEYQVDQITEQDDTIVEMAIATAIEEVKSYFTINNQTQWNDGRIMYDADAIFNTSGTDRNPLVLASVKTVAKWYIIELSNVDMIFESVKERYDRSIKYLDKIKSGEVSISTLPTLDPTTAEQQSRSAFRMGSRTKFNHE